MENEYSRIVLEDKLREYEKKINELHAQIQDMEYEKQAQGASQDKVYQLNSRLEQQDLRLSELQSQVVQLKSELDRKNAQIFSHGQETD